MLTSYKLAGLNFDDARAESDKDEQTLFLNVFAETEKLTGLLAMASRIQDIILMDKGTNPSALGMGVGIRDYLTDLFDDNTKSLITREIDYQIKTYIPSNHIIDIEINNIDNGKDGYNTLYILFNLADMSNPGLIEKFALSFAKNPGNISSTTVSRIYI